MNDSCDSCGLLPAIKLNFNIKIRRLSHLIFLQTTVSELDGYLINSYYSTVRLVHESIIFQSMVRIRL